MADQENIQTLCLGEYIAEVLHCNHPEFSWYYIIQRQGSSEVLDLQRFTSLTTAKLAAMKALAQLHGDATSAGG